MSKSKHKFSRSQTGALKQEVAKKKVARITETLKQRVAQKQSTPKNTLEKQEPKKTENPFKQTPHL